MIGLLHETIIAQNRTLQGLKGSYLALFTGVIESYKKRVNMILAPEPTILLFEVAHFVYVGNKHGYSNSLDMS